MKALLKKLKAREAVEWILYALSLGAVLQYCVYRFLQSTMFNFYYSQRYKLITMGLLLVFGGIRYLYVIIQKWKEKNTEERKRFILRCIGAWLLALPFFYVGWLHDYKNLIFFPICSMCLYDVKAEKVCKAFVATIGTCLLATILCCLSGTVRNLVSADSNFAAAYGFINTTDFASYFTILLLLSWCGLKGQKWQTSLLFAFLTLIITYGVYKATQSRTLLYTSGLTILFVLWDCLESIINHDKRWIRPVREIVKWISTLAFPIIGVLVIFLTAQYAAGESWAQQLNQTLSGRLSTVLFPYRIYGIAPFGNKIESMHGQGGTILGQFWSSGYSYLDVAYAMLAIRYGWIITTIVIGFWIWMTVKAFRTGNNKIGYVLAILAAHAFSEARILDVNYNVLLIMPFSFLTFKDKTKEGKVINKKRVYQPLFVGVIIAVITWLVLPRGLSWLRTFFYLKEWKYGTAALKSLLLCAGIVLALLLLWKSGTSFWEKHDKKQMIPLAGLFIVIAGSILAINKTIDKGYADQIGRLSTEERVIRSIQESATMPTYAADSEELYRRDGVRLSKCLFSVEQLGKNKGTIIVDSSVDAPSIMLSGGMYAQISDQTGLYTFDPSVIEMLREKGYEVARNYTGVRHCDLRDLALYNHVEINEHLRINSQRVITSNSETDQLFGQHQVKFALSGLTSSTEGDVVLLEVFGERGERLIAEKTLSTSDFDKEGKCECVLEYQTIPTPGVSYSITAKEGVSVVIDDISWRRIQSKENEDLLHNTISINSHTSAGVKYTGNPDGTVTVTGEATDISIYNIYLNKHGFPDWLQKGKEYVIQTNNPNEMVSLEIYLYDNEENIIFPALVSTKTSQLFRLPDAAGGIIIRFRAWDGKLVDTTFTPIICEN